MDKRPITGLALALTAFGAAASKAAAQTNNTPRDIAIEKLLASPTLRVAEFIKERGVTEQDFAQTIGGDPVVAAQVYKESQDLAANVETMLTLGLRNTPADTLSAVGTGFVQTTKDYAKIAAKLTPFLGQSDGTTPPRAVIRYAQDLAAQGSLETYANADLGSANYFMQKIHGHLTAEFHKDPSRLPLRVWAPIKQDEFTAAAAQTIGQKAELTAIDNGTNNFPNIGQTLSAQDRIAGQALQDAELRLRIKARPAGPGGV
jgi:hypothetical protein